MSNFMERFIYEVDSNKVDKIMALIALHLGKKVVPLEELQTETPGEDIIIDETFKTRSYFPEYKIVTNDGEPKLFAQYAGGNLNLYIYDNFIANSLRCLERKIKMVSCKEGAPT